MAERLVKLGTPVGTGINISGDDGRNDFGDGRDGDGGETVADDGCVDCRGGAGDCDAGKSGDREARDAWDRDMGGGGGRGGVVGRGMELGRLKRGLEAEQDWWRRGVPMRAR